MKALLRTQVVRLTILCVCLLHLTACDEDLAPTKNSAPSDSQRITQLQAQLSAEQAQRTRAEHEAVVTAQSRTTWVVSIGAGACVGCVLAGLAGIYIGSRALRRSGKEAGHG